MTTKLFAILAVVALVSACTPEIADQTTTSTAVETTVFTLPELPIEEVASRFEEGDLVAVFGFALTDRTTLWGLPTDNAPVATGGSGSFDRQAIDLVAGGMASSYDGEPPWEWFQYGSDGQFGGYIEQDKVGFLGKTDDVTSQVENLTSERVDDLALDVAQHFADLESLEVVQITKREFGGRDLTFDLVGGIDDLTAGWRLHVVMEEDGEIFRVVSVSRSSFCWFDVDDSGACTA